MAEQYGSPTLNDRIAHLEQAAMNMAERIREVDKGFEKAFPRPVGSQRVDPRLEAIEYATSIADDNEGWKALIRDWRGQGYNFRQIVDEAQKYTARNERRLGKIEQELPPRATQVARPQTDSSIPY